MSEFDRNEWMAECSFRTEMLRAKISKEAESHIWTMKNGERIAVEDMTDSHLLNAYRMLERNNMMDMNIAWLDVFQKEIKKRNLKCEFNEVIF